MVVPSFDVYVRLIYRFFREISAQSQELRTTTNLAELLDLRVSYRHRSSIFLLVPNALDEL